MNSSTILKVALARVRSVPALLALISSAVLAQSPAAPPAPVAASAPARIAAPDGAPELALEKSVSNTSVTVSEKSALSVVIDEERVQGRLSSAHVSVGGARGYSVVDPTVGRVDRNADNGGKRVRPSLWELFRF